jgi:hypothetical protein
MQCNKKPLDKILADLIVARNAGCLHIKKRRECRAYFCKQCRAWHLTSESKQEFMQNIEKAKEINK